MATKFFSAIALIIVPSLFVVFYYTNQVDQLSLWVFVLASIPILFFLGESHLHMRLFLVASSFFVVFPFVVQSSANEYMIFIGSTPINMAWDTALIFILYIGATVTAYMLAAKLPKLKKRERISRAINPLSALLVFLGCFLVFFFALGNQWMLLPRIESYGSEIPSTYRFLGLVIKAFPAFVAYEIARTQKNVARSPVYLLALITLLVVNNPVNSPRFLSLASLGIAVYPILARRNWLNFIVFSFPVIGVVVLPLSSSLRHGFGNLQFTLITEYISKAEFSSMIMLNEGMTIAENLQGTGSKILSGFFILLPRSVWPQKSEGTGVEVADKLGYLFSNIGIPPLFDFYLDLGWAGVFLISAVSGYVIQRARNAPESIFSVVLFMAMPILVRGDFSTVMISIYAFAVSALVARQALRLTIRSHSVRESQHCS